MRETHMTSNSTITPELLDQLLANYEKPEDLTGEDGLFKQLKKALIERALGAELTEHLGYEKGDPAGRGSGNSRNGRSANTTLPEAGEIGRPAPRLTPQASEREDDPHRGGRNRPCDPARPGRQLRAAADRQGPDPVRRLRRQDSQPLRPWHDGARAPGPPRRALRNLGLTRPDQPGYRCGSRRGPGVAEPAARPGLSGGVLRRAAGQNPRRGPGQEQGGLCRPGAQPGRREGRARVVDRADRRRQVLAQGRQRAKSPRRQRYPDCRRRWAQSLPGGHHVGISGYLWRRGLLAR